MAGDSGRGSRRLLVLGAGPAQLGLLEAARARGLYVIAADRDPAALGFRYADRRALISAEDERGIQRLAEAERVDGIIAPGIDWPVSIAAQVAERLGLPHPIDSATAGLATSKLRQRERLAEAGIPQPGWRLVTAPSEDVEVPCVVKPPDRQGQRGLGVVTERSQLPAAVAAACKESRNGACIVEELIDGPEVTVNGFSVDGEFVTVAVTDRLTALEAFGVAVMHVWPSVRNIDAPADAARAAAAALGIRNGPTYTQIRLAADGPRVIELAARLGGGHDAELCHGAVGVDLNGLAIDVALGEAVVPPEPSRRNGGACTAFLLPPDDGELREVEGVEEAAALDGVEKIYVYRMPGFRFSPLETGSDRAGAILAVGDSREEALDRAGQAVELIRFHTFERAPA